MDFSELAAEMGELATRVRVGGARVARETQTALGRSLPHRTPRRSGRLAAGWQEGGAGDELVLENPEQYAAIIDRGRRRGRSGRMLGSEQAPRGIVGPALEQLDRQIESSLATLFEEGT